jgi:hypothetical protein
VIARLRGLGVGLALGGAMALLVLLLAASWVQLDTEGIERDTKRVEQRTALLREQTVRIDNEVARLRLARELRRR